MKARRLSRASTHETARPDARAQAQHRVRGGGLPEHRRVLEAEARDGDDPGRRLHPRLRLLQRRDRQARPARPARARACRRGGRRARPGPCRRHLGRPRRPGRRRRRAFRARHPRDPRARARHDDRGADARLPAQGGRDRDGRRGAARRLQPQSRNRAAALSDGAAGRALLPFAAPARPGQADRSRRSSPSPASWSGWARRATRCCR